jgi:hypothetical protein
VVGHLEGATQGGTSLSERSVPQGTDGAPISVADSGFCEELAEYLGIKSSTAKTAFLDEPTQRVLGVASWAVDKSADPEERARMVIAWAKKRGAGAFKPVPDEYISLAGSVGHGEEAHYRENETLARLLARYWHQHPHRLARVLEELEIWVNVFPEQLKDNGRS